MQSWVMIAIITGFKDPVIMPFESEDRCRTAQAGITAENNRLGREIQSGCYVLTPNPSYLKPEKDK